MKLIYLLIAIVFTSCGSSLEKKSGKEMIADSICFSHIQDTCDYWLYSDFLLKYPKSEYYKNALLLYHKKRNAYYDSIGWPIIDCFRNCANIKIRPNLEILFEYKKIELADLKDSLLSHLINIDYSELKPEKKKVKDFNGVLRELSKGHVELTYIKDSCENIQDVLIAISESYNLYKNHLSKGWYKKEFNDLDKERVKHLDVLFQYRLLLYEFDKEYLPPPPPPESEVELLEIVDDGVILEEEIE